MTNERFNSLMDDDNLPLTQDELAAGWHFCYEFDGLLRQPKDADDDTEHPFVCDCLQPPENCQNKV